MRTFWGLICLTLLAMAPASRAADYPTRPIKMVVPYVAGGPTDVLGRMVAEYLSRDLKQSVFIENKGGAQGAIGAEAVAHADPDGYTVLFTASSVLELNPMLYKKLSYDPDRELQVIAVVTDLPSVMVVHPKVRDVAVFGIPDDDWGEHVKAVVEPAPGVETGPELAEELLAYCKERLAGFKIPRSIDFVSELPRDPNGKLYKRKLRDPYWAGRERAI